MLAKSGDPLTPQESQEKWANKLNELVLAQLRPLENSSLDPLQFAYQHWWGWCLSSTSYYLFHLPSTKFFPQFQMASWSTQGCVLDRVVCSKGALQGTVLVPLLFSIYTTDFTQSHQLFPAEVLQELASNLMGTAKYTRTTSRSKLENQGDGVNFRRHKHPPLQTNKHPRHGHTDCIELQVRLCSSEQN